MNRIPHWIGGSPTTGRSERTSPVYDPATGQQSAEVVLASRADVDHAVATAATAFETWSQSALSVRTKVMFAFRSSSATARPNRPRPITTTLSAEAMRRGVASRRPNRSGTGGSPGGGRPVSR